MAQGQASSVVCSPGCRESPGQLGPRALGPVVLVPASQPSRALARGGEAVVVLCLARWLQTGLCCYLDLEGDRTRWVEPQPGHPVQAPWLLLSAYFTMQHVRRARAWAGWWHSWWWRPPRPPRSQMSPMVAQACIQGVSEDHWATFPFQLHVRRLDPNIWWLECQWNVMTVSAITMKDSEGAIQGWPHMSTSTSAVPGASVTFQPTGALPYGE